MIQDHPRLLEPEGYERKPTAVLGKEFLIASSLLEASRPGAKFRTWAEEILGHGFKFRPPYVEMYDFALVGAVRLG